MYEFRYPNITGKTTEEKVAQIGSYLYQFVEQLQWAVESLNTNTNVVVSSTSHRSGTPSATATNTPIDSQETFNAIKALIIKSADIVDAYYTEIRESLESEYTALSEFGEFKNTTSTELLKSSNGIEQIYTSISTIDTNITNITENYGKLSGGLDDVKTKAEGADKYIQTIQGSIKTGQLGYDENGKEIYGIEVGQKNIVNDVETFNKYARFTADRLSFYDKNDVEVAYISDEKLYIKEAEIIGNLKLGKYVIDTTSGLAFKWAGGE